MSFRSEVDAILRLPPLISADRDLTCSQPETAAFNAYNAELEELWLSADEYLTANQDPESASKRNQAMEHLAFKRPRELLEPRDPTRELIDHFPYDQARGIPLFNGLLLLPPGDLRIIARPDQPNPQELQYPPEMARSMATMRSLVGDPSAGIAATASGRSYRSINIEQRRNFLTLLRSTLDRSYSRLPEDEARRSLGLSDRTSYCTVFLAPAGQPDVALVRAADTPTEVRFNASGQWKQRGTLREGVVAAVAELVSRY